jgi:NAD(P)-dependent dehydrogenase (short-subunit alcohol dehydrogenase family)
MSDLLGYRGKRGVVIGCASGMGAATARSLVQLGAEVWAGDVRPTDVPVAAFHGIDLADPDAIGSFVEWLGTRPVDFLFNCAGLPTTFPPQEIVVVNFVGMRHLTEQVIHLMPAGGAIVTIASVAGLRYNQRLASVLDCVEQTGFAATKRWCEEHSSVFGDSIGAYAFSKECILVYTMQRGVALVKDRGIRMNATCPGPTKTPMDAAFRQTVGDAAIDALFRPMGRDAEPEEQANALLFLNSDMASNVVGHALIVDGGTYAYRIISATADVPVT